MEQRNMNKVLINCETIMPDGALANTDVILDTDEIQLASFPQSRYLRVPGSKSGAMIYCISVTMRGNSNISLSFITLASANTAWAVLYGKKPVQGMSGYHITHNDSIDVASYCRELLIEKGISSTMEEASTVEPGCIEITYNGMYIANGMKYLIEHLLGKEAG